MFRLIALTCFIIALALPALHFLVFRPRVSLPKMTFRPADTVKRYLGFYKDMGVFRELVFIASLAVFALLFVTGFFMPLLLGEKTGGYLLMVHLTFAPVFIVISLFAVFLFAKAHLPDGYKGKLDFFSQALFWLLFITSVPLFASILLSMLKLFGTETQYLLLDVHRYSATAFTMIFILLIYVNTIKNFRQHSI